MQTVTPWQEFYQAVKDPSWPECDSEQGFFDLPESVQKECQEVHGYKPGEYSRQSSLRHRGFPIKTTTACQLKWNWSTVFLTTGKTGSCHRTNHHKFDPNTFDFHNTPQKIKDRERMLQGQWPEQGCEYCRHIELAGGQSDRMTNLDMPGMHAPKELDDNPLAVMVTPRILEVYFDNTCNLKCTYCGPHFSSLWDAENKLHGRFEKNGLIISSDFAKDPGFEKNKHKVFEWLRKHSENLTTLNVLGGEPLFQTEFEQVLDQLDRYPAPQMMLQIFTNLNVKISRLQHLMAKVKSLIDQGALRSFTVTASLDCWGPRQEYARFPLDLVRWEENFLYLLHQSWIDLVIGSTVTPLTATTLSALIEKINQWNQTRPVLHYFNSVNYPSYMMIDILGDMFVGDLERALDLMPVETDQHMNVKQYLRGIQLQSASRGMVSAEALKLRTFLDEMDRRRNTNWRDTFPELRFTLDSL